MKKLLLSLFVLSIFFSSSLFANPCRDIAKACMKAGYYKGGNSVGKGLVMNCMLPVTAKKMELPNTTFTDQTLNTCHSMIMEKMQ